MKTLLYTTIAIFLVIDFALGQEMIRPNDIFTPDSKILSRAPENYLRGLQRNNLGVVESSMLNVMKLRTVYPEGDYSKIITELERLQNDGQTKSIRFMAFIAYNYFQSPERFTWLNQNDLTAMDSTLSIVSVRLKSFDY